MSFFSTAEKKRITEAITMAEKCTSGEIRVHVESKCKTDVFRRAQVVFSDLGMEKTQARNGTLIYLAMLDKKFAILGDEGINRVVPSNFWENTRDMMAKFFTDGEFCEGVCRAIQDVGGHLKKYFPYQSNDVNELSDDISEGN